MNGVGFVYYFIGLHGGSALVLLAVKLFLHAPVVIAVIPIRS